MPKSYPRHRLPTLAWSTIVLAAGLTACDRTDPPLQPDLSVRVFVPGIVSDTLQRPVAGVAVNLLSDPGVTAVTDANGSFSLMGWSAPDRTVPLELLRGGYLPLTLNLPAPEEGGRVVGAYRLVPEQLLDLTGDYDLTVTSDRGCSTLPAEALLRTYQASVTPTADPAIFAARLSGATLTPVTIRFDVAADAIRTWFATFVGLGEEAITEHFPSGAALQIFGLAAGSMAQGDQAVSVPLDGSFQYCFPEEAVLCGLGAPTQSSCLGTHQLTLARR